MLLVVCCVFFCRVACCMCVLIVLCCVVLSVSWSLYGVCTLLVAGFVLSFAMCGLLSVVCCGS